MFVHPGVPVVTRGNWDNNGPISLLIHVEVLSKLRLLSVVPSILFYSIAIVDHSIDSTNWLMPFLEVIDMEYLLASSFIRHTNLIIYLPCASCDHVGTLPVGYKLLGAAG